MVEYVPMTDESIINNILDRINKNMARLTYQELRHARFSGHFITTADELTDWMFEQLGSTFPRIAPQSIVQMKDVELVAQLLLLIEEGGAIGQSKDDLDKAHCARDVEWIEKDAVIEIFKSNIRIISEILDNDDENILLISRLKNQAVFYSLFDAVNELSIEEQLPDTQTVT